uniref:D-threo-3-hydroxyaspartate dehydratase-like n=1 Tax=Sinocyclocheilus grahami TaxID=75366 RepID=A0A672MGX4_SINGR
MATVESVKDLRTPALIIDLDQARRNAEGMLERFLSLGFQLRPHMKTHKTLECADIMTGGSRRCIVVSTLAEASFDADNGYDDILYAYPLLSLFHAVVDNRLALQELKKRPLKQGKISDTSGVELTGMYAHCGNTYASQGEEQIKAVARETTMITLQFMEKLKAAGIQGTKSSIGSTPSCSHPVPDMAMLSEVHPGNYIFYGLYCHVLLRAAVPHWILLWVGSHDGGGRLPTGYAIIEGHPELKLLSMTQEHGRVEPISGKLDFKQFPLGSLLTLMPYHACATAMMHPVYFVHSKGKIIDTWKPARGW